MNIDRHNYEEFFILYLDNELSAADRQLVEEFAEANPDLKAELDLLMQSKLVPETDINFDAKASLLKPEETVTKESSSMLLYLDNEMNAAEKKSFEEWLSRNPAAQKEFAAFKQTKFQPEAIVFPYKESLYRQEERRVVAIRWWRMAAAAALLLGVSTAAFMFNQNKETARNLAAARQLEQSRSSLAEARAKNNNASTVQLDAIPQTTEETPAEIKTSTGSEISEDPGFSTRSSQRGHNNQITVHQSANPDVQLQNSVSESDISSAINEREEAYRFNKRADLSGMLETSIAVNSNEFKADPSLTIQKEINPLPSVTPEEDQPLDIMEEPGKKNRFRGFFRKITRTFEKTTNIKATDGDDRLLVGGLAIKL